MTREEYHDMMVMLGRRPAEPYEEYIVPPANRLERLMDKFWDIIDNIRSRIF